MFQLTEDRFLDFLGEQPETGMGYWIVTIVLKNGKEFPQVVVDSGYITKVRGYDNIPFRQGEIDHIVVTHDKWDFRES